MPQFAEQEPPSRPYLDTSTEPAMEIHPLGAFAVASDTYMHNVAQLPLDQTPWDVVSRQMEHYMTAKEVRTQQLVVVRETFGSLRPEQAREFDDYMESASPLLLKRLGVPSDMTSWHRWLSDEADDDKVLDVVWWHGEKLREQQQSPLFKQEVLRQSGNYAADVEQAIGKGWIHREAHQATEKVKKMKVYIGDYFDTVFQEVGGYHWPGTDYMVLSQGDGVMKSGLIRAKLFKHETNHTVLGYSRARHDNEATMEYIAQRFETGKRGIWPDQESDYPPELRLMHLVHVGGRSRVPIELRTRAYSARSEEARAETGQELDRVLDDSWGMENFREKIDWAVENREQYYKLEGMPKRAAEIKAVNEVYDSLLSRAKHLLESAPRAA